MEKKEQIKTIIKTNGITKDLQQKKERIFFILKTAKNNKYTVLNVKAEKY